MIRLVMKIVAYSLIVCPLVRCETLPDAPKPKFPALDRALIGGIFAAHIEDDATTQIMRSNGAHEAIMPTAIAYNPGLMAGYAALTTFGQYEGSRFLIRHHHKNVARALEVAHLGSTLYIASHNLTLGVVTKQPTIGPVTTHSARVIK